MIPFIRKKPGNWNYPFQCKFSSAAVSKEVNLSSCWSAEYFQIFFIDRCFIGNMLEQIYFFGKIYTNMNIKTILHPEILGLVDGIFEIRIWIWRLLRTIFRFPKYHCALYTSLLNSSRSAGLPFKIIQITKNCETSEFT